MLALVFAAHQAETQALLLWFVGCRGGGGGQDLNTAPLSSVALDPASLCGHDLVRFPDICVTTDS